MYVGHCTVLLGLKTSIELCQDPIYLNLLAIFRHMEGYASYLKFSRTPTPPPPASLRVDIPFKITI